ncbi:MAG TPA: hypothetical protein VF595_13040 [Tepidisphaeraceae bacterium]|jgi:hypothetical protein
MKKPPPPEDSAIIRVLDRSEAAIAVLRRYFASYFGAILKNVLGFLLILLAFPAVVAIPIPGGGLLMFLVGFAMVAFPGKRKITSTLLRGRPLRIEASIFTTATTAVSLLVIAVLLWFVGRQYTRLIQHFDLDPDKSTPGFIAAIAGVCVGAAMVTWVVMWLGLRFTNFLIRLVPRLRRLMRPMMRKYGIRLLPPPQFKGPGTVSRSQQEIIEFSPTSRRRFYATWAWLKPWLIRVVSVGITVWLFYKLIRPVVENWDDVEPFVNKIRPMDFVVAVGLFVLFLFVFRVLSWWTLLRALGRTVPIAPATRVWSTSELARYLPGVIWQVIGRMYLIKPYGVSGSICSTSQVLELIVFMLANIIVAVACLLWFGFKQVQGDARWWLIGVMALLPTLALLLHPSVFYALMNRIIRTFKRPPLDTRVPGLTLVGLLAWNILGLCVMSLGIWMIVHGPLQLPIGKWWVVAGAYCLAWSAGFLAFWASAGIGVREWVFMLVVVVILPPAVKNAFDHDALRDFAGLVAIVLRAWATTGELVLALIAYTVDLRGALSTFRNRGLPLPTSS